MGPDALLAIGTRDPIRFADETARAWEMGNAVLPIDHRWSPDEVRSIITRFKPAALLKDGTVEHLEDPSKVDGSTALVMATSGTTGLPKGVEISHQALKSSITITAASLGASSEDSWCVCLPTAHIAGIKTLLASMFGAATPVVIDGFDLDAIAADDRSTLISLVPTQLARALGAGIDMTRFKAVLLGGGPIPQDLVDRASDHGVRIVRTYGMTETCGGCIYDGFPIKDVQMRINDDGVIELAGPMLFARYRLDAALTKSVLRAGWFTSGDVGVIDAKGRLTVHGRADDTIITGGQNVAPIEVEEVLVSHPDVLDCGVTGLEDSLWGQRIVALIVTLGDIAPSELRSWCGGKLANYKIPKSFARVEKIDRNKAGKIIRRDLLVKAQNLLGKQSSGSKEPSN